MKIAIFSDIHSNFTAYKKAFSIMEKKNVDKFLCTGDLVGYGPQPNRIINDLKTKLSAGVDINIILGNHDYGVINPKSLKRFNSHAKKAIQWTKETLTTDNLNFLKNLPQTWQEDDLLLAHGTPNNPIWEYLRPWNVEKIFTNYDFKYCFVGHTHLLQAFTKDLNTSQINNQTITRTTTWSIPDNARMIINVGSIGQPRDHDHRSSFIIWDTTKEQLEVISFDYNINHTQNLIYQSKLPDFEGDRLSNGR